MSLIRATLDPKTLPAPGDQIAHERNLAIFDLVEDNDFCPVGVPDGEFSLNLSLEDNRLVFAVSGPDYDRSFILSQSTFRSVMRDYAMICDSYAEALKNATPSQIESIDMGRRGVHNDGAALLVERFRDKIHMGKETSRRLFTLIFSLHLRA